MTPALERFLNPWGLIKPRANLADGGGNDPLYTALYLQRLRNAGGEYNFYEWQSWRHAIPVIAGKYELKPGLFVRRPPPDILHQETFDNVLAWIAISGIINRRDIAKRIVWYGLTHFGFFNTDGKLKGEDWLWRHLHIWAIAVPTAFTWLAPIYRPWIWFLARFINSDHPGGWLLDWLWFQRAEALGVYDQFPGHHEHNFRLGLEDQMDRDHPIQGL